MMRLLVVDIETAPHLVHVWRRYKIDNIAPSQVIREGYILCFAAKWVGSREMFYARVEHDAQGNPTEKSRRAMLDLAHKLLSEADAVVHYNGTSFDIPWFNSEFLEFGYHPPRPFRQIDLLLAVRKQGNFPSNKLEAIARRLDVGAKVAHEGHALWRAVMVDDESAWRRMERYNKGDVRLTERLYKRILGWIPNHPNRALYVDDDDPRCPNCGSKRLTRNGSRATAAQRYQAYECQACGFWPRGTKPLARPVQRRP